MIEQSKDMQAKEQRMTSLAENNTGQHGEFNITVKNDHEEDLVAGEIEDGGYPEVNVPDNSDQRKRGGMLGA